MFFREVNNLSGNWRPKFPKTLNKDCSCLQPAAPRRAKGTMEENPEISTITNRRLPSRASARQRLHEQQCATLTLLPSNCYFKISFESLRHGEPAFAQDQVMVAARLRFDYRALLCFAGNFETWPASRRQRPPSLTKVSVN